MNSQEFMISMITLNVLYYDDDKYDLSDIKTMAAGLLKALPQSEVAHTIILPKSCQFVQYPLTNDEYYWFTGEKESNKNDLWN